MIGLFDCSVDAFQSALNGCGKIRDRIISADDRRFGPSIANLELVNSHDNFFLFCFFFRKWNAYVVCVCNLETLLCAMVHLFYCAVKTKGKLNANERCTQAKLGFCIQNESTQCCVWRWFPLTLQFHHEFGKQEIEFISI